MKQQSSSTVPLSPSTSRENHENKGFDPNVTDHYNTWTDGIYAALETYSNVHRGSGHFSMVTTHLYEKAREVVLEYLGLKKRKYTIIFSSRRGAEHLKAQLKQGSFKIVTSKDFGLPLGVYALAVKKNEMPGGEPFQTGGGTTKLISRDWVIWAVEPDRFEAGTPAIINIIAFARALQLIRQNGKEIFSKHNPGNLPVSDILYRDELEKYSGKELLEKLRQTMIGCEMPVPTTEGNKPFINLDNAASTPTFEPIWKTVWRTWMQPEQVQKEIVKQVRTICSDILEAPEELYDVIFTSNTTEAINLAAESLYKESEEDIEPVVITTLLEHSSNDLPWRKFHYIHLPVDAAQMVAHRRISMERSGIDYLAFSAHKVYAPFGSGVLVVKKGLLSFSQVEMEIIRLSGEENTGGIAALGKSLLLLQRIGYDLISKEEQELTAHALRTLAQVKGITIYGIKDPDSARFSQKGGVIVFGIKGRIPFSIAKKLAIRGGIGVRVGCHCAHIIIKHILNVTPGLERFQRMMQTLIPAMKFPGLVRISLGIENKAEDIDELVRVLDAIAGKSKTPYSTADGKKMMMTFTEVRTKKVYTLTGSKILSGLVDQTSLSTISARRCE